MIFLINKIKLAIMNFIILLMFACNVSFGADIQGLKKAIAEYKVTHSLPVNNISTPQFHIVIQPIKGFVTQPENFIAFYDQASSIIEYIPRDESFENWSKIITIQCLTGQCIAADKLINTVRSNIESQVKRLVIIKEETAQKDSYLVSKAAIQYQKHDGIVEVLYMEYYSGPLDCSGIQYTEKVSSWLEGKLANAKAQEIEKAISQCVNVLQF